MFLGAYGTIKDTENKTVLFAFVYTTFKLLHKFTFGWDIK